MANALLGTYVCDRNGIWAQNCCQKPSFSCGFSIPRRPPFGVNLGTKEVKQSWVFGLSTRSQRAFNVLSKANSANRSVGADFLEKEFEFKPSFEEYLKAMESVKTGREKKQTSNSQRHMFHTAEKRTLRDYEGDREDGYVDRASREFKGFGKLRFGDESDSGIARKSVPQSEGKESRNGVKFRRNLGMDSENGRWLKKKVNNAQERQINGGLGGLSFKTDKGSNSRIHEWEGKESKSGVKINRNFDMDSENGRWVNTKINNVQERQRNGGLGELSFKTDKGSNSQIHEWEGKESKSGVKISRNFDMDSKTGRWVKKKVNNVQERQRNGGLGGLSFKTDKGSLKGTKMGIGLVRNYSKVESVPDEKTSLENVKLTRRNKIKANSDDEEVEVERAAFKSVEESNDVVDKPRLTRNELEERIQKLARCLNGADIDMPEWMFSKMMRSAKIRYADHSMVRIIQILGKLGNWRRVLQLIEWLQMHDRFKSHKMRYIYTTALVVLGKARRPVEALNLFHAMQQHMSTYPDVVAYHQIAVTLGQAGHMKELFEVIDSLRSPPKKKFKTGILENWDPQLEPDIVIYNAVLNACVRRKQWEGAFWVLQQLKEQGRQLSSTTYGLVMEVMFVCGKYNLVHDFFKKVLKSSIPNALTYKVLVNTLWKEGKTDEAVSAVKDMERRGIIGSAALYYDLARCLCSAGRCQEALVQIDKICKVANKPLVVTYTGLIQACLDAGNIEHGAYIFNHMPKFCTPNLVTCNIMLKAYVEHGMFEEAKGLFWKILEDAKHVGSIADYQDRVIPDIYTFNTMLDACVTEQQWDDVEFVYKQMLHYGFHFNAKRHLRMIMDACRVGKGELLETTWKHLISGGQTPPPLLAKEIFCMRLEQGDHSAALSSISTHDFGESQVFSRSSWLNFFKGNATRFQMDSLVRLVQEGSILMSRSNSQSLVLQNLFISCREFLKTHVTVSKTYSCTNSQLALVNQL